MYSAKSPLIVHDIGLIAKQFHYRVPFQNIVDNEMLVLRTNHGLNKIVTIA